MEKTTKISEVSDYKKAWKSQYGELITYYVKVADFLGVVEINKKPDSSAPVAGEELAGTFTQTDYVDKQGNDHFKFKAANKFGTQTSLPTGGLEASLRDLHTKVDKVIALLEKHATGDTSGSQEPFDLSDVPDFNEPEFGD